MEVEKKLNKKVNHISRNKIKARLRELDREGMQDSKYYQHLNNRLQETRKIDV